MKSSHLAIAFMFVGIVFLIVPCGWAADTMTLRFDHISPLDASGGAPSPPYGTVTLTLNADKTITVHMVMDQGYFTNSL
jgi:hypothetical protein